MYKKLFKDKKVVTFDLDGTLVQTAPIWDAAFRSICDGVGVPWPGFDNFAGVGLEVIWDKLISSGGSAKIAFSTRDLVEKTEQKFLQLVAETHLEENMGFWELAYELKEEKKFKLALVSNSSKKIVDSVLAKIGIHETFDVVVCGDEISKPKPSPEIYKQVAKLLKVHTKDMVSFEDSPVGAKSAVDAGCTVIVVYDGSSAESDYPSQVATMISGFDDVAGRMDLTFKEVIKKTAEQLDQLKKEQTQKS